MTAEKPDTSNHIYAVVRLRGSINIDRETKAALSVLNLKRTNNCVLVPKNRETDGMLKRVKNFVTYGEITHDMLEKLIAKRGRKAGEKKLKRDEVKKALKIIIQSKSVKGAGIKPVFRLSPSSGGLKSVKTAYPKGDLGYRGEEMNKLLERMI
jgi:large subunit ribosomal protein L30